eukprot:3202273-Pyramimonas_sp.AAC.1
MGMASATVTERGASASERSGGSCTARPAATVANSENSAEPAAHPSTCSGYHGPIRRMDRRRTKLRYILTTDRSGAGAHLSTCRGLSRTNQTHVSQVYSHDGPIRRKKLKYVLTTDRSGAGVHPNTCRRTKLGTLTIPTQRKAGCYGPIKRRKRKYILTTYQSDKASASIFSRRTNQTQEAQVYSHDGPIRQSKHKYILTTEQSDEGSAGTVEP